MLLLKVYPPTTKHVRVWVISLTIYDIIDRSAANTYYYYSGEEVFPKTVVYNSSQRIGKTRDIVLLFISAFSFSFFYFVKATKYWYCYKKK